VHVNEAVSLQRKLSLKLVTPAVRAVDRRSAELRAAGDDLAAAFLAEHRVPLAQAAADEAARRLASFASYTAQIPREDRQRRFPPECAEALAFATMSAVIDAAVQAARRRATAASPAGGSPSSRSAGPAG
jgi:hypothetical protein